MSQSPTKMTPAKGDPPFTAKDNGKKPNPRIEVPKVRTFWTPVHTSHDKSIYQNQPMGFRLVVTDTILETLSTRCSIFRKLEKVDDQAWSIRFADDCGGELFTADVKSDGWSDSCVVIWSEDAEESEDRKLITGANLRSVAMIVTIVSSSGVRWLMLDEEDDELWETPDLTEEDLQAMALRG